MSALREKFNKDIIHNMAKELGLKNINEVPKLEKIVVSAGVGRFKEDKELIKKISNDLMQITGQKPKINLSKKAVSAFKLRIGQPIGLTVTLRGERMYAFVERLTLSGMPRIRDFKGLKRSGFDGKGNYSLGVLEQTIMPEIKYDNVNNTFGFQVNIKISTENDRDSEMLLTCLGFPFEKIIQNHTKSY